MAYTGTTFDILASARAVGVQSPSSSRSAGRKAEGIEVEAAGRADADESGAVGERQ